MMLTRRRFLSICAAAASPAGMAGAAGAGFTRWRGMALGAECSIILRGPAAQTEPALAAARTALRQVEALFNLYDPSSALSRLNTTGQLSDPDAEFLALMDLSAQIHALTGGLFDPSIQPLWQAHARGDDTTAARARVGWSRVTWDRSQITLAPGQALSFNGIAQGFATDLVADTLVAHGLGDLLVDIGEIRGLGGPWRLGLSDPDHGHLGTRTLHGGAIATSSPRAMQFDGGHGHIFDPKGQKVPRWSTVSVEARSAAFADALSTALCLMDLKTARALKESQPDLRRITCVGFDGDLITL